MLGGVPGLAAVVVHREARVLAVRAVVGVSGGVVESGELRHGLTMGLGGEGRKKNCYRNGTNTKFEQA